MSSNYPGTLPSFSNKEDNVDVYAASMINQLQDDVVAIATELGTDVAGSASTLKVRLARSLADSGDLRNGTSFPVSEIASGTPFYRSDLDTLYIYDGSTWDPVGGGANTIFSWLGTDEANPGTNGAPAFLQIASTATNPTFNSTNFGNSFYGGTVADTPTYSKLIPTFKWTKPSGINTAILHIKIWSPGNGNFSIKLDVGGQSSTGSVSSTLTTPTWRSSLVSVDISSLSTGTTYDVAISGTNDAGGGGQNLFVSGIIIIGS